MSNRSEETPPATAPAHVAAAVTEKPRVENERAERLAAALRANLHRRKDQTRGRAAAAKVEDGSKGSS